MPEIRVRRVYDAPSPADGARVLVDRIWPRGEAACWAHLVCPECGAIETEGHRAGCGRAT